MKFKIFKVTPFKTTDGVDGVHYTVTHKGRFIGINSLNFADDELKVTGDIIEVPKNVELLGSKAAPIEGQEGRVFINLVPKLDIDIAAQIPVN